MQRRLLVLVVTLLLALGGCGLIWEPPPKTDMSNLTAQQILNAAERRVKDVDFVSVEGKFREDGQTAKVDMAFAPNSSLSSFVLNGAAFKVLSADGKTYVKLSKSAYRSLPGLTARERKKVIDAVDGRWIDPGDDKSLGSIASFGLRLEFFDALATPVGKPRKGPEKQVKGIACIPVTDKESTIYVDKRDGTPILQTGRKGTGRLTFSYARVAEFKRPSPSDIVKGSDFR